MANETALSQQGWYACDTGDRKSLCFDEVKIGGQAGKVRIDAGGDFKQGPATNSRAGKWAGRE